MRKKAENRKKAPEIGAFIAKIGFFAERCYHKNKTDQMATDRFAKDVIYSI